MTQAIGILGFGTTGKAAYAYLKKEYPIYIYDAKLDLSKDLELTKERYQDLAYCIKSPGIHPDQEIIQSLEKAGVPIYSDIEVFQKLLKKDIHLTAITGTNGKTTTSMALAHILQEEGKRVHLAGNIGKGVFDLMDKIQDGDYVVLECSSFQLKYIEDFHPNVAILTNITQDHLDWHKTVEDYQESKKNLVKNLGPEDLCIVNKDDPVAYGVKTQAKKQSVSVLQEADAYLDQGKLIILKETLGSIEEFQLVGNHNISNLSFAILAANYYGIALKGAFKAGKTFKAADHRLQYVDEIHGIPYYNDSKGTNTDSTDVALESFSNVTLIAGGYDKGSSFLPLLQKHKDKISHLIVLGQTKDQWLKEAKEVGISQTFPVDSMEEAVKKAKDLTKEGVVLLSPACASWGMYQNFVERGNDFMSIVHDLKEQDK